MSAINNHKLLHYVDRMAGDFRPITADVFLTNYCNNHCGWCTYNRWELDEKAYSMPFEDFKTYVTKLLELGVKGIILTGGGEPTVNKDFDKIVEWLDESGIPYGINTNFNILKYFRPEYLKVSLDGYSEESYKSVRKVEAYEQVCKNVSAFADWKEKNSPKTKLGIQKVVTDPDDIVKFYEANKALNVDYIVFRPIESTQGIFYTGSEKKAVIRDSTMQIRRLMEFDSRVILNYKWEMLSRRFDSCYAHWAQIALDEKGNVIYCCHKPYEIIGHIMDDDILEKYARAKTDMSMCDIPCRLTAPNDLMEKVQKNGENVPFI